MDSALSRSAAGVSELGALPAARGPRAAILGPPRNAQAPGAP